MLATSTKNITECPPFDTFTAIPEEGRLSPVGIYFNISYKSSDLSQPDIAAAGHTPESRPNYAFGVGSASSPAATTTLYSGSKVKFFALTSVYCGCETKNTKKGTVQQAI